MDVVYSIEALQNTLQATKSAGSVALVPTMGNLHAGHLALVDEARARAHRVFVSIFVNPMQFGASEDLAAYPRTLQADIDKLQEAGADLLFAPNVDEIYPAGIDRHTQVTVPGLTDVLCGASRPGHFDGVTTVVCRLFNLVAPDVAVFGEKDLQQLLVIRKMVHDLGMPVTVIGVPTIRDSDGLAMSSRNQYLTESDRAVAPRLPEVMKQCREAIENGENNYAKLQKDAAADLTEAGFTVDYFAIYDTAHLRPATSQDTEIAIFAAAYLGKTRLIDNLTLAIEAPSA